MEHSNNRNMHGFSFIEVILTIALIGAVITPVFVVQFNVLNFLTRSSDKVRSIFLIDSLFAQSSLEETDEEVTAIVIEKTYENPALTTRYVVKQLPEKSPLKRFEHLYFAQSRGSWQRGDTTQSQQEVSFLFKPPQEKKEQEKKVKNEEKAGTKIPGKKENA